MVSAVANREAVHTAPARPSLRAGVARFDVGQRAQSIAGIVGLVVLWAVASRTAFRDGTTVPHPETVVRQMFDDRHFYGQHIAKTVHEAAIGYAWGVSAAVVLAVVFFLLPLVERAALRLVIAIYCLPLVATGPVLSVVMKGDGAKSALAAQSAVFVTLIGVSLGLRSAEAPWLQVVHAAGGGRWQQLVRVRIRAALPNTFAGLKVAGPAALLGAIIGEYLGQSTKGLGVAMVASQASYNVPRTWALAMVMTLLAAAIYGVTAAIGRVVCPWDAVGTGGIVAPQPSRARTWWGRVASHAAFLVVSIALILLAWSSLVRVLDLNPYFAKTPSDVWEFLVTSPNAATNRTQVFDAVGETVPLAALGYVVGTAIALVVALGAVLSRTVERIVMPAALAVRSIPLIAMTPLIALVFGRGLTTVLVITGTVTFFPSLVQLMDGLRAAPAQSLSLVHAFGGGRMRALATVRLPYALPNLFAAARITAPLAILGTVLAEWLATGKGVGHLMAQSSALSAYNTLWACVVVITACSITVYGLAATLEALVLRRFGDAGDGR